MTAPVGRSVRLFLVDGSPTGVVTAEIVNWSGHALLCPRAELSQVRRRPEFQKTGVYFLFGEVATISERRRVYVGEGDDVGRRIEQHTNSKSDDFFERFCLFTSKDSNLTKSHARYLESRLTAIARNSGRADVVNVNTPPSGNLPESDIADMEFFISQIEIILPVLGFDILKSTKLNANSYERRPSSFGDAEDAPQMHEVVELLLTDRKSGVSARARFNESEYVVIEGSTARKEAKRSLEEHLGSYFALRQALKADGSLLPDNQNANLYRFSRDVVFKSPSAASAVILGRSDNGRRSWRVTSTNELLADYQERLLREQAR